MKSRIWENLLVESVILGFGIRNTAQGIRNRPTKYWNPESKFDWQILESSIWNPKSTAWNPESEIPYMERCEVLKNQYRKLPIISPRLKLLVLYSQVIGQWLAAYHNIYSFRRRLIWWLQFEWKKSQLCWTKVTSSEASKNTAKSMHGKQKKAG